MVDAAVINRKLQQLESYLTQLEKYKHIKAPDLEKNIELAWIVEHGLQLSIQVVLDIGTHILAEEGIIVDEYSNIFDELAGLGVLPEKFARDISGMAGFRNILVHEYGTVDLEKVADVMNYHLDDFRQFTRYIVNYLGWSF
ncbi:type VII toxin-antitoxin system HepT family RNase toxin [Moorella sulfitireducens]|uniref:type VII toxin-antitoxin system HepT family RNase toxin n=1 Tax=Neomoorella sulfitireducens TaxID=2972948 RepID=UPI0021ACC1F9|nr:DUF86 domain-containing protein [Moorella sulfitireducens]